MKRLLPGECDLKRTWFSLFIEMADGYTLRWVLRRVNRKVVYRCAWGDFDDLYSVEDILMCRPIHPDMRVAPPWAVAVIVPVHPGDGET